MNRKSLSIIAAISGACLGVAAISDLRVRNDEMATGIVSCSTKRMMLTHITMEGEKVGGPGIYSIDKVVDLLMNKVQRDATAELAGNPFAGLGMMMLEGFRPTVKSYAENLLGEGCRQTSLFSL